MMSTAASQTQSTTDDDSGGLPSFTTFQNSELETSWDFYERTVAPQPTDVVHNSYTRPWEMESKEHQQQQIQQIQQRGFEPFPKLPSFQSQFHSFSDTSLVSPEPSLPTQITAVPVPISPSSASPGTGGSLTQLTQLTASPLTSMQPGNFHTLTAVNTRACYPLVPAPIQARDIPSMQQQYLDERHIQLYQPITTTTFHHPAPPQQMVTVIKNESVSYDLKNGLHHSNFQSPMLTSNDQFIDINVNQKIIKNGTPAPPPTTNNVKGETRKRERRKIRASSLESSTESDASSAMDIDGNSSGNPGQVSAVSSTANFKSPMQNISMTDENSENGNGDKQV